MKFLALLFLISGSLSAAQINEDFTTSTNYQTASTTAVLNLVDASVELPLYIDRDQDGGEDVLLNIGNGSDGIFDSTTYANFDIDGDTSNSTVLLDTSKEYQFTSFELTNGMTLTGSGTSAIRIRVQGRATIDGTINVNGNNGQASNADITVNPSGGTACCGGAAGGAGGSTGIIAQNGVSSDTGDTGKGRGGTASVSAGNGSGGGGGGGMESGGFAATAGATPAGGGAGGVAGSAISSVYLDPLVGGSGGGGGAVYSIGIVGDQASGGAGGAGGGAVLIFAGEDIRIGATGSVLANGGNGGAAVGRAGAGGGGGGGAIYLACGGLLINAGTLSAIRGTGGASAGGGGAGGNGGVGRVQYVDSTAAWVANQTGSANPGSPNSPSIGRSFRTLVAKVYQSKSFDLRNTSPTYSSVGVISQSVSADTVRVELAGSSDDFVNDDSGYVTSTAVSSLNGKRYLRFKVTLQSGARPNSPKVTQVDVNFSGNTVEQFNFETVSCAAAKRSHSLEQKTWPIFFFLLLLALPWFSRRFYIQH